MTRGANKKAQMSLLGAPEEGAVERHEKAKREDRCRAEFVRALRSSFREQKALVPDIRILALTLTGENKDEERVTIIAQVGGKVVDGVSEDDGRACAATVWRKLHGDVR